jgi:hypothetical protein
MVWLSIVMWIATTTLWVWSYSKPAAGFSRDVKTEKYAIRWGLTIAAGRGSYWIWWDWAPAASPPKPEYVEWGAGTYIASVPWEKSFGGFSYSNDYFSWSGERRLGILAPSWLFFVVFAILPVARVISIRRANRRIKRGLCRVCSYDLRFTPDRCPECGTVPQKL